MKHCHISILCNEITFLKQKLEFLYNNFEQIIFVDYDIMRNCNSSDGSIEFIENFEDKKEKITLIKFNENDLRSITNYNGVSMVEKRIMFAKGSQYIKDDIDLVWATDMDEFFDNSLISIAENEFKTDEKLITLNIPHFIFIYNQFNILKGDALHNSSYICPARITKHFKNKIYGHCNFESYGKTIKCDKDFIYHFGWNGLKRNLFKLNIYNRSNNLEKRKHNNIFLNIYYQALIKNEKYINISHPNPGLKMNSIKFEREVPDYIDIDKMMSELNDLSGIVLS